MTQSHGGRQAQEQPCVVQCEEATLMSLLGGVTAREERAHLVGVELGSGLRLGSGSGLGSG